MIDLIKLIVSIVLMGCCFVAFKAANSPSIFEFLAFAGCIFFSYTSVFLLLRINHD